MKDKEKIKEFLTELYYEFFTESAWSGHEYGFEYMKDYYEKMVQIMKGFELKTDELRNAYNNAYNESERITNTEGLSFIVAKDREQLVKYDRVFLDTLAAAAQTVNNELNIGLGLMFW